MHRLRAFTTTALVSALASCFSVACGGGNGNGAGGGGSGGCSLSIKGDAASGVGSMTVPCGFANIESGSAVVFQPAVEVTYLILGYAGTDTAEVYLLGDFSAGGQYFASFSFQSTSPPLPLGPISETSLTSRMVESVSFGATTPGKQWFQGRTSSGVLGSLTVNLTGTTSTGPTDCYSSYRGIGGAGSALPVVSCSFVHGTVHAVLAPNPAVSGNTAAGTVTLDWTF